MARSGKYSIVLSWLNTLGGWEYWNFEAFKTYGYDVRNAKTIKKDIFEDFDVDFIAGGAETELISIEANESIIVRSQNLTKQQINAIARIKFSISVRDVSNGFTVLVDNNSFQYRTDNDKTHFIEFVIKYPSTQIQSL